MCKIWIFGGTTEGRLLAEYCSREKIEAWVSVASEYGEELLQEELMESGNAGNPDLNHNTKESGQCADKEICFAKKSLKNVQASSVIKVLRGRMDRYQMEEFIRNQGIHLVIDATHPHARLVSEEIQEACGRTGVRLERCLRAEGEQNKARDWVEVDSIQEAVSFLSSVSGVIFATTGSKELEALCQIPDYQKRVYARVLPTSNVLKKCEKLGITGSHLIAMQGPFSTEMNTLFLRQTKAEWLLTKDSGRAGGFQEKVEAARENGTRVVVIRRPEENGISLEEAMEVLKKADEGKVGELKTHLILAGIGMGQPSQMTGEVLRAIRESDALIGAGRMLESAERALQNDLLISKEGKAENRQESAAAVEKERKCYKAYLPDDVIQIVSEHPEWKRAVILYSGDTGFFSGASRMAERLREAGYPFTVYPGTSCVSYLAARLGTHWEDAAIYSAHGRELSVDRVMKRLCDPEEPAKRAFILMGGKNGAGQFCERLTQAGYGNVQVTVGENLSYPEEQIRSGTAEEMKKLEFADLSLMLLEVTDEIKNVKQLKRFEQEDKRLLPADSVGVFPRIMLAAPKSGSGKTLLTCGLLEVLRRRGLNPIACKCGPDYIDPMFHRYVLGIPGRNLDSFFLPTEGVRKVLVEAVREEQAGIAVLEGVMGYYDGFAATNQASSWAEQKRPPAAGRLQRSQTRRRFWCWTVRAHRCRRQQWHLDFYISGKKAILPE